MPVGAREEEQTAGAGKVAEEAFKRGEAPSGAEQKLTDKKNLRG